MFTSTIEHINSNFDEKDYTSLSFFDIAHTKRNWIGEFYISGIPASEFVEQLLLYDQEINAISNTKDLVRFSFLLDASVFYPKAEENLKLLEFLEELDDFTTADSLDSDLQKVMNKYLSKLRYFASKPENYSYLLRWVYHNHTHPFHDELQNILDESMKRLRTSFNKKFFNDTQREPSKADEFLFNKTEEDTIAKLLKYCFAEPSLFYFGALCVSKWFEGYNYIIEDIFQTKYIVTLLFRDKRILTDIYQGKNFDVNCLWFEELMGDFLGLVETDYNWATANFSVIGLLDKNSEENPLFKNGVDISGFHVNEEILKSVATWAAQRIYSSKRNQLPKSPWFTNIEWNELIKLSAHQISIFAEKEIVNERGTKDLVVFAKVNLGDSIYVVFPLIDPTNWGNLTIKQKAFMTYAICLYHDITVENAYEVYQEDSSLPPITYPFPNFPQKLIFEGNKMVSRASEHAAGSTNRNKKGSKPHKEHWVTFHFRKLPEGMTASKEAIEKANKYGITLPNGFTFIDSYTKGKEGIEESGKVKISAIEIFNKMVSKL